MAKVQYIQIPEGQELKYKRVLKAANRFIKSAIRMNSVFISRERKKALLAETRFLIGAAYWQGLTNEEREAWAEAGEACDMTGYQVYTSDINARQNLKLTIPGTPSPIFQVYVGKITIPEGETKAHIIQEHPEHYTIKAKVTGSKSMFSPVEIHEKLSIPLKIGLSYKADLTANGGNAEARFYAEIISHYQGRKIYTQKEINLNLQQEWTRETLNITNILGWVKDYSLNIEINNAHGVLFFDNIEAEHGGQNWARDPRCDKVAEVFARPFQTVIHNWKIKEFSEAITFESTYFN